MDHELERVRKLARILDDYFVDPIVGLVLPGAGDIIGAVLGVYTINLAFRRKVSPVVIARMFMNLGLDALVGIVPLVGDVVDLGYKANRRNVELLAARETGQARAKDWLYVVGAAVLFVGAIALAVWALTAALRAIF